MTLRDNVLLRDGIARLVESQSDLELTGTAADLPALLALIEREATARELGLASVEHPAVELLT